MGGCGFGGWGGMGGFGVKWADVEWVGVGWDGWIWCGMVEYGMGGCGMGLGWKSRFRIHFEWGGKVWGLASILWWLGVDCRLWKCFNLVVRLRMGVGCDWQQDFDN